MTFRHALAFVCIAAAPACASHAVAPPVTTPVAPAPAATTISADAKVAWILRLEQTRVLRDGAATVLVARPAGQPAFAEALHADLTELLLDPDPGIRRRAAQAIGRTGRIEGVPPLLAALAVDPEEHVRAAAAFGLGLVATSDVVAPLQSSLSDSSPLVRGRAAEALGLVGTFAKPAAPVIAGAFGGCRDRFAGIRPDDETTQSPDVEACRLALFALVRIGTFDHVAALALAADGRPASEWWPIAFALQRIGDARAAPALLTLASSPGIYTSTFAMRGLTALKDARVVPLVQAIAVREVADVRSRVAAVRALGQIGGAANVNTLVMIAGRPTTPPNLALEVVAAIGAAADPRTFESMLELTHDPSPAMRSAALAAAARANPESFLLVISSIGLDRDWSVRAALATVFGTLPADRVRGALEDLSADADARVRAPALEALAKVGAPDLAARLFDALGAADYVVRATAARLIGEAKPEGGSARLVTAYTRGASDAAYDARAAAIEALAKYGGPDAKATITSGLADPEWPVRLHATTLLHGLGELLATPAVPAPTRRTPEFFESARVLHPPYSPHAYIETPYGVIELELNVIDAPVTTQHFIELARAGFFNGLKAHRVIPNFVVQTGDPRGDGEGGPGFTIRDELSPLPYLRGVVGMALSGPDTGGSQFFITLSPQPHLTGKYTVFGKVVKGDEFLDLMTAGDVITAVRIVDGVTAGGF